VSDLGAMVIDSWRTNSRVTSYLFENLPDALWDVTIPGAPRRTVRMIAGHLHNARCSWVKTLGSEHGVAVPVSVDRRNVTLRQLLAALKRSSKSVEALLEFGLARGGHVPPSKRYVWRNLPLDVPHILTYLATHEAHHRGQIVMLARELDQRLPSDVSDGLWHFARRAKET
jgi:uncharacterized damage-inducible protein DinB